MAKRIALILAGLAAVYLAFLIWQASEFLAVDNAVSIALGVALLLLALLGIGLIVREIKFGNDVQIMVTEVDFSAAPEQNARLTADEVVEWVNQIQQQIKDEPENYSLWYHMASAYEMSHDRPAARQALRHALRLFELSKQSEIA